MNYPSQPLPFNVVWGLAQLPEDLSEVEFLAEVQVLLRRSRRFPRHKAGPLDVFDEEVSQHLSEVISEN